VKVIFATSYDADPRLVCKLAIEVAAAAAELHPDRIRRGLGGASGGRQTNFLAV
jgi:hypothetical protein